MKTISSDALAHVHGGTTINIDLGSLVQQIAGLLQQPQPQQGAPQQGGGGFNLGSLLQMFGGLMGGGGGSTGGQGGSGGAGAAGAAPGG